jgi:hypothetical protein
LDQGHVCYRGPPLDCSDGGCWAFKRRSHDTMPQFA